MVIIKMIKMLFNLFILFLDKLNKSNSKILIKQISDVIITYVNTITRNKLWLLIIINIILIILILFDFNINIWILNAIKMLILILTLIVMYYYINTSLFNGFGKKVQLTETEKIEVLNKFIKDNVNSMDDILIERLKNKVTTCDISINKNELLLYLENVKLEYRQEALTKIAFIQKDQIENLEAKANKTLWDTIDINLILKIGGGIIITVLIIWLVYKLYHVIQSTKTNHLNRLENVDFEEVKLSVKILEEKVQIISDKLDKKE